MPVYLDRHDVTDEVDAKHVAKIHIEDLKFQDKFGCKALTYWFDEVRKTGYCLFEAPNEEAINRLHNHAHGGIPTSIIEVDENEVKSFLGRIADPEKKPNGALNIIDDSAFRTILVLKFYPTNLKENTLTNYSNILEKLKSSLMKTIEDFKGSTVKVNLEDYLVSFDSVNNAMNCANFMRTNLLNNFDFNKYFTFRIGGHCGDPVRDGDKLFGKTILLASRICEYVSGNLIVSADIKSQFYNKNSINSVQFDTIRFLNPPEEDCLNLLIDFLEQNYTNPKLQLQSFCKNMGFSKSKLYRKVKSLSGKPLNRFIKEFRLRKALLLLKNKKNNISEIAYATGFSSPTYFSRCFKEHFQTLPSLYL